MYSTEKALGSVDQSSSTGTNLPASIHGWTMNCSVWMFASRAPFPGIGDYAASKAAVAAYGRAWARDLGSRHITVNTIQPGPINTEMNLDTGDMASMVKQMTRTRSLRSTG